MKTCESCRFWSERCAYAMGHGPIKALCLSGESPYRGRYTTEGQACPNWKSGELGAVDTPGEEENLAALYADLDSIKS